MDRKEIVQAMFDKFEHKQKISIPFHEYESFYDFIISKMSAKDLFLAFCDKAGINVSAHKNKTDIERFGLFNGVGMAEFLFDKDGNFIKYDIFKGGTNEH